VLKWLHSFHLYATHFWVDHLLAFAKMQPSLKLAGSTKLIEVAYGLASILASADAANSTRSISTSIITDAEGSAEVIKSHGLLYNVVMSELKSRDFLQGSLLETTSMLIYSPAINQPALTL
jgi:hypothetical protein